MLTPSKEIKSLIKLALPVSLAQLSMVGMSATDVLVAGNAGTIELAGMNLGANTWNMIVLFFMGIGFATQPLVAKQFGAKNRQGVKKQLHQSTWMCLALGVIAMIATLIGAQLLLLAPMEEQMRSIAYQYLVVISLCAIPTTLIPAVRGSLEGMSLTRPVFVITFMAFLLNIPLDYVFVNGLYGFPRLGGVGCALATAILVWLMFLALVITTKWHPELKQQHLLRNFQKPDAKSIRATFKLGLPIGVSIFLELSMFCGAGMLIASFGSVQAGAHAVAITVASMSFMIYMGLGQGVTIRASQFLGAQRPQEAWYTVKIGTVFNVFIAAIFAIVFVIYRTELIQLFSNDAEVISLAVVLLLFGAAFQLADSLQVAVMCALRAYHDTSSPPKYQFVAFWVFGLPLGVGLAFFDWWPGLEGAKGMWAAMIVSLFAVGFMLLWRLNKLVKDEFDIEQFKVDAEVV